MSEITGHQDSSERDDETMSRLLRLAGEREDIPPAVESRVYDKVLQEWQGSTAVPAGDKVYTRVEKEWDRAAKRRNRRRWYVPVALAASALLAFFLLRQVDEPVSVPPVLAGTVVKITGGNSSGLPSPGSKVLAGDTLQTGPGEGLSLRLANNESLRLGSNTRLVVNDDAHLQLQGGRIYADSGEYIYRDGALTIETGFGVVRDIGTQFAVVQEDGRLEVAVREGRVDVTAMAETYVAVAGERMSLETGAEPLLQPLSSSDAYWDWTTELAPSYDIENKSLHDFLRWAARETGSELVFADEDLRLAAMREDLHGSIADFSPEDALASVLPTTRFNYRLEDGRILIDR